MLLGKLDSPMQKNEIGLTPYTKINSKWVSDPNMRKESDKILEKNTGSNFCDLGCSIFLRDKFLKASETQAKMN